MNPSSIRRLLNKHGIAITLTKKLVSEGEAGVYDPDTSQIVYPDADPEYEETPISGRAAFVEYSEFTRASGLVESTDKKGILQIDDVAIAPEVGDTISDGSKTLSVIKVDHIRQGSTVLAYICQVRI